MSGWYTSMMNYDTLSTNPWNVRNLHMNQLYDHSQAWWPMFNVQSYGFDTYMPYGNNYGGSNYYLTDPMYTIKQGSWGTPFWNNNMWNANSNNFWNNGMYNPFGFNNNGSTTSTSSDPEEEKFRNKYNKLLKLVKELEKYEYLPSDKKSELTVAINNTKGTNKEKFDNLLAAYKKVDKATVEEFLAHEKTTLTISDDSNDKFYTRLAGIGYEYKNTPVDTEVEKFYNDINNGLQANQGGASAAAGVIATITNNGCDVLDFISSYNSKYHNKSGSKRIIDHIGAKWSKVPDTMKSTVYDTILVPLVDALITKAQNVKGALDDTSQDAITEAIEKLETEKSTSTTTVSSGLSAAFDKLYLLTRNAATAKLRNDAIANFGHIDNSVFNDDLFDKKIAKDLEEEGFTDAEIIDAEVLLSDQEIRKTNKTSGGSSGEETPVSPEVKAERERKKAERQENAEESAKKTAIEMTNAGIKLNEYLTGWAWENETSMDIDNILSSVNKDNVMELLTGYYVNANKLGAIEGLIERLDDEFDGGKITMINKKKLITSFLEKAKEVGLETSTHYVKIQSIMRKYEDGHTFASKKTFNNGYIDNSLSSDGMWSAIGTLFFGSAIGFKADNEIIDEHLEALFNEIRAKQASKK